MLGHQPISAAPISALVITAVVTPPAADGMLKFNPPLLGGYRILTGGMQG